MHDQSHEPNIGTSSASLATERSTHETTATEHGVIVKVDESITPTTQFASTVDYAPSPDARIKRGVLPRTLEALYNSYAFSGADTAPAFAYNSVEEWRQGTSSITDYLAPFLQRLVTQQDRALGLQEWEFLEKMQVNWRLRGFSTLVPHTAAELNCRNVQQADALRPIFQERRSYYMDMFRRLGDNRLIEIMASAPVVLDKGKGSPLWIPGTDPTGAIALRHLVRRASNFASLHAIASRLAGPRPTFIQTSYIRIQSARGAQKGWRIGAPHMRLVNTEVRGRPKVRRIAAQPFLLNHWWVPYAEVLRTVMALSPFGQHAGRIEPVLEAGARWPHLAAFDLKSYDTTVAYETHVAIRDELWLPLVRYLYSIAPTPLRSTLASPDLMAEIDEAIITMPVLTPPTDATYAAGVWTAVGQTRSGENPTSWKGTEIRRAQGAAKQRHIGASAADAFVFNYGDDTLVLARDLEVIRNWAALPSFLGMNEEPAPDSTFLMRRVPNGYSYLMRMVMASINREASHEPANELAAAAAFAVRYNLLAGHPLQQHYLPSLGAFNGTERFKKAVRVATAACDAGKDAVLRLSEVASRTSRTGGAATDDGQGDIASSLRTWAESPFLSAEERAAIMASAKRIAVDVGSPSHALPWIALDAAAADMATSTAQTIISKYRYRSFK